MSISIAVCDDDESCMKSIIVPAVKAAAHEAGASAVIRSFTDGRELIGEFENDRGFDIVILDIDMPEINGKALAQRLRVLSSAFFLVFITSYKAEVFNTIPYRINAFIPKDSPPETMRSELRRVISQYREYSPEYKLFEIIQDSGKAVIRLTAEDIFCFCCIRRNVYLKTGNKTYRLSGVKISGLAKDYAQSGFFEICRGYIVNISKVRAVDNLEVELDNGERLPLSRRRAKELMQKISEYVTERAV